MRQSFFSTDKTSETTEQTKIHISLFEFVTIAFVKKEDIIHASD